MSESAPGKPAPLDRTGPEPAVPGVPRSGWPARDRVADTYRGLNRARQAGIDIELLGMTISPDMVGDAVLAEQTGQAISLAGRVLAAVATDGQLAVAGLIAELSDQADAGGPAGPVDGGAGQ